MAEQFSHWRNSQRPGRFFMFDARASAAFIFVLLHFRLWTLILALLVTTLFWALEQRGLTFEAALRAARAWLAGYRRPALSFTTRRRLIDLSVSDLEALAEKPKPPPKEKGKPAAKGQPAAAKPVPARAALNPDAVSPAEEEGVALPPRPEPVKTPTQTDRG